MILTRMYLENYGLFREKTEFDLRPREKYRKIRPVILFGGKNGAGKTTFLEAIRLLFYGRRSLGSHVSQKDYHAALLARVHRNKSTDKRATYAKVGIEFELVMGGEKHVFFVERSWAVNSAGTLQEWFQVDKNGEPLGEIGSDHWESFIADIVPERLSQLFFFDGEKIKSIAEDLSSNEAIAEAIQSLLGLDAVSALESDLTVYRNRILKRANPQAFEKDLAATRKTLVEIDKEVELKQNGFASVNTKIDGVLCEIRTIEGHLQERGGSFAQSRDVNKRRSDELDADIKRAEREIRDACEGALPFALCPTVVTALLKQVEKEEALRERTIGLAHIDRFGKFISQEIRSGGFNKRADGVSEFLEQLLGRFRSTLHVDGDVKWVQGLSPRDAQRLTSILVDGIDADTSRIIGHLEHLEASTVMLHEVMRDLNKAPDESDVKESFEALAKRHQTLGGLEQQKSQIEDDLRGLLNRREMVLREEERLLKRVEVGQDDAGILERISRMGPALQNYRNRLTEAKISALQTEVTECFNRLARKSDFVRGILIDAKTFQVNMVDQQGRVIPKEELSSGEKQIFAIALLWGLARTSGRPLPIVVDTPLGRLDSDHRAKLIENYFPNAGHQVILLSTDTEVDQDLCKSLSPHISHAYHLDYDHDDACTYASEEYFWRI